MLAARAGSDEPASERADPSPGRPPRDSTGVHHQLPAGAAGRRPRLRCRVLHAATGQPHGHRGARACRRHAR